MNLNDKSDQGSEGKRVMNVVLITAVSLSFLISSLDFCQEA